MAGIAAAAVVAAAAALLPAPRVSPVVGAGRGSDPYRIQRRDRSTPAVRAVGFGAVNLKHELQVDFADDGPRIRPLDRRRRWRLDLALSAWGRGHSTRPVRRGRRDAAGRRIEYGRGALTEWYVNDARGLEQGFTLAAPPTRGGAGPVALELRASGDLTPQGDGSELAFRDAKGAPRLRYAGLRSWDSAGRPLPSRLELRRGEGGVAIALLVDDADAVYPITIDPLVTAQVAKLTAADGASTDEFGSGAAIDGDTVVIGAHQDDDLGMNSGSAYVFTRNSGGADTWGQVAKLTAANGAASDDFGAWVSLSGSTALVGARRGDGAVPDLGAAYLFERNQGGADSWDQVIQFAPVGVVPLDSFGWSGAIDGDTAVVGAYYDSGRGAAFVFERNQGGADNWGQVAKLTASDGAAGDEFGYSVSISGDLVVVGAQRDADAGSDTGSAYVYERNQGGADNWGQVRKLTASDLASTNFFGGRVEIDVDTVIVAAGLHSHAGVASGSAYVFERNRGGANNWGEVRELLGADRAAGDVFAYAAIHGDTAVVGARNDDDAGADSGSVYVFERNQGGADNWGQAGKLVASDGAAVDQLGWSTSINGDAVAAGAPLDDDAGASSGSAYVFSLTRGAGWGEIAMPLPGDPVDSQVFGESVSISGDTAVSGARYPVIGQPGAAYVYSRNQGGADGWGQVAKLTAGVASDQFGAAVSISGDRLVSGAPTSGGGPGTAYVFERNQGGADAWGQVAQLSASDGAAGDFFGDAIAMDRDTAVVGARGDDDAGNGSGSAYLFARNLGGADAWGQRVKLVAADAAATARFGVSAAIDGDTLVVGADTAAPGGAAYVFARNQGGVDNWGQVAKLVASDASAGDLFGSGVAIDGDTIAVGAPGNDDVPSDSGSAYIFRRNQGGADAWGQAAKIVASDAAANGGFGNAIAIVNDRVVVGASFDDQFGSNTGAAYVFERNRGGADAWGQVQKLVASAPADNDVFGYAVAASSRGILVGASQDEVAGTRSGSTHLFVLMDPANLAVAKSDTPDPALTGSTLQYSIDVTNAGPAGAANVTVTDMLPSQVSLVGASGPGWTCSGSGSVVTCTRPLLGVGAAPSILVDVTPQIPALVANTARVAAWTYDPDLTDNEDVESTTVNGACIAPPAFSGVALVTDAVQAQCAIQVLWAAATPVCGAEVSYSVYRGTSPAFVPSAATRIASGLTTTLYTDASGVSPGVTYYYVVRAADLSNGVEDANLLRMSASAAACAASAPAGHEFFNVRSGSTENTLLWVNPVAGFNSTRVIYRTDTFPTGPGDPMATLLGSFGGLPGDVVKQPHPGLTDGTTYYYAIYADDGTGTYSTGKTSWGRPDTTAGAVKWGYTTGAMSLAVAGVIPGTAYYSVSQDRVFNAMEAGTGGGSWPTGWTPLALNDVAQDRTTVGVLPSTTVGGASRLALAGAQDGRVYAVNAETGALLWASPVLGGIVQASPVASLVDFGGAVNIVLVGTRDTGTDNKFYGLNVADGSIAWTFDNGGVGSGIGRINARARVDAGASRVYFTSNERAGGSADTVWCLSFDAVSATREWSTPVGDVNAAVTRRGNVLYVGNTNGDVSALDVSSGGVLWTHPSTGDGAVKDLVLPDYTGTRLYFSTTSTVHAINDDGSAFWGTPVSIASPSPPFLLNGQVYVGADMGRLYKIDGTAAVPPAPSFVVLGAPAVPKVAGTPTFDGILQLLILGTDEGAIYGVALPF